jgi:release factor glutamine methyltransferase
MTAPEPWTIGKLLTWTTGFLREHGSESPRLDAEVLLAFARGCQRIELYTAYDEVASEDLKTRYRELVRRRADDTPVAYLVGRKEFYSLSFEVTREVLIPRPETELLVVALLDRAKSATAADRPLRIADVGTGSGILAVCAARMLPAARITAIDISEPALEVARRNAEAHGVADRIEFIRGDLLASLPADLKFDFVLSNPPYIGEHELSALSPEVRNHEPHIALIAGPSGTEVIARLISQAADRLNPGGWLVMEVSPIIAGQAQSLFAADGRFEAMGVTKDLQQHARVIAGRRKA